MVKVNLDVLFYRQHPCRLSCISTTVAADGLVLLLVLILLPLGLVAVASCGCLRELTVGSFNLVGPLLGRRDLRRLEHLSFGGGFANKGLHLLFPLLDLKSLHVTVSAAVHFVVRCGAVGCGISCTSPSASALQHGACCMLN